MKGDTRSDIVQQIPQISGMPRHVLNRILQIEDIPTVRFLSLVSPSPSQ